MIGKRLLQLRTESKLSQYELAKRLKMARTTYAGYESGAREPDIETIRKFSEYYGKSVDWLTTGEEMELDQREMVIRELVKKYDIDLSIPNTKEKLEQIIQLVFGDMKK